MYVIATLGDCLRQIALEGQYAAYPGIGTPTANDYISQSRAILQGPNESPSQWAPRAIAFRTAGAAMGSNKQLALNIQAFLCGQGNLGVGIYPVVAIVDRSGDVITANANQTITPSTVTWTWDNSGGFVDGTGFWPPSTVTGWYADQWIVIQDPFTHYTGFSDPNWLAAWNSGDQTVDSLCPQAIVQGVFTILAGWKAAHEFERCILWVPNVATFLASGPNGYWGNWSHNTGTTQTLQRTVGYSFWTPPGGG
jgi:hypothetical protein